MTNDNTSTTRRTALKIASGAALLGAGAGSVAGIEGRFADQEYDDDISAWVLRLEDPAAVTVTADSIEDHKKEVNSQQAGVVETLAATEGVSVQQQTWIANAILVDTETLGPQDLITIDGVTDVHPNFTVDAPEPVATQQLVPLPSATDPTYGLTQINAPQVWEEFETQGDGASVAVLDTGIDADHPDLELADDGWAQFDAEGNELDTDPNDPDGHGTHVSGTVAGGAASGLDIGVAPAVDLLNAKVLDDGGTFVQIIAGIEWAVEQDADIINMSLGAAGYASVMIEPVRNAQALGTLVVSSSGNDGAGTSGSPANVYDTTAVGATDPTEAVTDFSSGERIHTPSDWEDEETDIEPPEDWPTWYTVPNLAAPGAEVISSYPGGSWQALSGTSMASPHVAGAAALIKSLAPDLSPAEVQATLTETTIHPAGANRDTRFGRGILNAFNMAASQEHDGRLTGTVTVDGDPEAAITVETAFGTRQVTNDEGMYELSHPEGSGMLAAATFGFSTGVTEVTVDGVIEQDLQLEPIVDVAPQQGQPPDLADGESFDIVVDVTNLEELAVSLSEETTDIAPEDVTLAFADETFAPGESITFDEPTSVEAAELSVTVDGAVDEAVLSLTHSFSGLGDTRELTTGPTTVRVDPDPAVVQIADPNFQEEVGPNGTLTFNPTLENTGDLTAEQTVQMVIEDIETPDGVLEQAFGVDVTLAPGETRPESIPIGFSEFPRQEATQRIVTDNDEAVGTFDILNSEVVVLSENVPDTGTVGRTVAVEVTLQNNGEVDGSTTLTYQFDDVAVDQATPTVAAGEQTTVTLTTQTDGLDPGSYVHAVSREDTTLVEAQITLEEPTLHESGVPVEIVDAILPDGAETTLGVVREAVDDWSDDRRISGIHVSLGQLRTVIDWWAAN